MIRDDFEYRDIMKRIDELFDRELSPEEAAELNRLVDMVEVYEQAMLGEWEDPT